VHYNSFGALSDKPGPYDTLLYNSLGFHRRAFVWLKKKKSDGRFLISSGRLIHLSTVERERNLGIIFLQGIVCRSVSFLRLYLN